MYIDVSNDNGKWYCDETTEIYLTNLQVSDQCLAY